MKLIEPTKNEHQWPRNAVKSVECRKRDLVIRITDWTRDRDEPAYDVECYIGGVYDYHESRVFSTRGIGAKKAKQQATTFAHAQIRKLL